MAFWIPRLSSEGLLAWLEAGAVVEGAGMPLPYG